jgi:hypothetical protein
VLYNLKQDDRAVCHGHTVSANSALQCLPVLHYPIVLLLYLAIQLSNPYTCLEVQYSLRHQIMPAGVLVCLRSYCHGIRIILVLFIPNHDTLFFRHTSIQFNPMVNPLPSGCTFPANIHTGASEYHRHVQFPLQPQL